MIVTLPYDPVWKPLAWAKEHCPSYITNDVHRVEVHPDYRDECSAYDKTKINYFFGNEKEALMFLLKWS